MVKHSQGNLHYSPQKTSWRVLYEDQQSRSFATSGWYARCRHPQYLAFLMIMFGFLLQLPTIPTLVMFPIFLVVYVRLANREEAETIKEFGDLCQQYAETTPAWIPKFGQPALNENH